MITSFSTLFLTFIVFSFFGWILETIVCSVMDNKLNLNRGFLIGPYCPIYGLGTLGLIYLIIPNINNPVYLFLASSIGACTLEYITSFLMEKIFNARWWDYSHERFNLNGRICLKTGCEFGLAGLAITYTLLPHFFNVLNMIPINVLNIISYVLLGIFIVDTIVSIVIIGRFKHTTRVLKDNTTEVANEVREELKHSRFFTRRLLNAFPTLHSNYGDAIIDTIRKILDGVESRINRERKKVELQLAKMQKEELIKKEKEKIKEVKKSYKETKKNINKKSK